MLSTGAHVEVLTAALSDKALPHANAVQRMHFSTLASCARYSPEQLFTVVADVDHYHEFVPWCQRSEVLVRRDMEYVEAELEVGFKLFVERCAADTSAGSVLTCQGQGRTLPGSFMRHCVSCLCVYMSIVRVCVHGALPASHHVPVHMHLCTCKHHFLAQTPARKCMLQVPLEQPMTVPASVRTLAHYLAT